MTSQKARSRYTRLYPYSVELRYFEAINGTVYERIQRVDHISPKRKVKHMYIRVVLQGEGA